jgi:zinc transport system substrate-binding protein
MKSYLAVAAVAFFVAACGGSDSKDQQSSQTSAHTAKPTVLVVNYPLQYFAERIGGEFVDVKFPAPPDVDPAFWMPDPQTVAEYQQAALILLNGADYAKWIERVSLPQTKLVNTSDAFHDRFLTMERVVTHAHGPGGEHAHAGTAFTTWIDLSQATEQAKAIKVAFVKTALGPQDELTAHYESLARDLRELDDAIVSLTEGHSDLALVASHPVYDYFARRYRLNLKSVLWEPDSAPNNRDWAVLLELLQNHPAQWMIWEGKPLPETVARLEEMGIRSVVFDPCGNRPDDGDFLAVMKENATRLQRVFADSAVE